MNNEIPESAVSIYGQNEGMEDFPVLKAFQQYIDAEQAKARKRLLIMGVFFGIVMMVVVSVFIVLLLRSSTRNDELNDKLIEYVTKDRDREIAAKTAEIEAKNIQAAQNAQHEATLKTMNETLENLQHQIQIRDEKMGELIAEQQNRGVQIETKPSEELLERERNAQEQEARIRKATALLNAQKEKLDLEKENLRLQTIELQRRRLYPDYYDAIDGEDDEIEGEITPSSPRKKKSPVKSNKKNGKEATKTVDPLPAETLQPIEYFEVDDWLIPAQ